MRRIGLVVIAAACGSSGSGKKPDAAVAIDAPVDVRPIDAALPDAPEPLAGHYHYVLSKQQWPSNANEARADGFDLDGNQTIDNQFGMVTASLTNMGFDLQTPTDVAIAQGSELMLADLGADDLGSDGSASFTIYIGANPVPAPCNGSADTTCGHHLHGTASFDVSVTSPRDVPLTGVIANGQLDAGPGKLTIQMAMFGGTIPITVDLIGARTKLTPTPGGFMTGALGGGITTDDRDSKIYPQMAAGFETAVHRDCASLQNPPQCGCTSNSQGAELISLFDTNPADCAITSDELKTNSLMMSLFAPDVTINNQSAISVGFAATAVDAIFTP